MHRSSVSLQIRIRPLTRWDGSLPSLTSLYMVVRETCT